MQAPCGASWRRLRIDSKWALMASWISARGPELGREPLDLGGLLDRHEGRAGSPLIGELVEWLAESVQPGPDLLVVEGRSRRSGPGRAGPSRGSSASKAGWTSPIPESRPRRRPASRGSRSAQLAEVAGRAVAEEVVERLADHPQAVLDGQVDQVGVAGREPLAEGEGEGLVADREGDRLVEDGEAGVDPRLDRVAAEDVAAERVERADPGGLQPPEDAPPAARVAAGLEPGPAFLADPLAKLAGRLVRERQGDDPAERPGVRALPGPGRTARPARRSCRSPPRRSGPRSTPSTPRAVGLLGGRRLPLGPDRGHASSPRLGRSAQALPTNRTSLTRQAAW